LNSRIEWGEHLAISISKKRGREGGPTIAARTRSRWGIRRARNLTDSMLCKKKRRTERMAKKLVKELTR